MHPQFCVSNVTAKFKQCLCQRKWNWRRRKKKAFRFVMRSWSSPVTLETSSLVNGLIPCAYPQVMFEINGSFFTVKMHWMTTYKLCLWNALQITGHKANIWRYVLHRPYPLHCIGILSFRSWSLFARIGIKLKIASYVK